MSEKKTILGKAVEAILSIFKTNWKEFLVKLWSKVPADLKIELLEIVSLVNLLKKYADLTLFDAIVAMTKTEKDNQFLAWARKTLDKIATEYDIQNTLVKDLRRGDWQTIAAETTAEAYNMPYGQAAMTIENAYQNL